MYDFTRYYMDKYFDEYDPNWDIIETTSRMIFYKGFLYEHYCEFYRNGHSKGKYIKVIYAAYRDEIPF